MTELARTSGEGVTAWRGRQVLCSEGNNCKLFMLCLNTNFLVSLPKLCTDMGTGSLKYPNIKGYPKKPSFFKIWCAIFLWTVGPRRLSFSGLNVLISTPRPEKDSLLGPTVHEKITHQILKNDFFLDNPLLYYILTFLAWNYIN